jgi:hypothetical protein
MNRDTKVKACVTSVLLYGCKTWLVTNELRRKIKTFNNRCLGYKEFGGLGPFQIALAVIWPNRYKYGDNGNKNLDGFATR